MVPRRFFQLASPLALMALLLPALAPAAAIKPVDASGRPLNLDFESGDLRDWKAEGRAFERQPIAGDTVQARRADMKSQHEGRHWIGTFELGGDDLTGTLTSVPFRVTHRWASFLVGGGSTEFTRIEIVSAANQKILFKVSGFDREELRPAIVDLSNVLGQEIFIRVIDHQIGGWGHINFDAFQFHTDRPQLAQAITPAELAAQASAPPADVVAFEGLSPADAAAKATVPPGFKVHLFAGEPDVRQPIAFCDDDRGRLWVVEGFTYPKRAPEGQGKDRILVFEDTNGDHQFDRRTVFMENLNLVSGIEYGHGGIWVGAAPYLMFIPVAESDSPRPAGPPQILLDGWDFQRDTHETLNTFCWGPDGWLYGCHGVFCPSHVGKPGAPESERQWMDAGAWRYHPTRHQFEVFTEGGSNPWGIDFDERGQLWSEMCVIPHLFHMIQGARLTRQGGEHFAVGRGEITRNEKHRETRSRKPIFPYVYEDITTHADHLHYAGAKGPHAANGRSDAAGGGHAHAGLMVYLGASWPDTYDGKLFLGNIHGQRLNMEIPVLSGSGYIGRHGPDFLNFNDRWSQTLNQRYDPDGSVYIIDWYDKNQCHHNREDGHDRGNGRIFKVVYQAQPKSTVDLQKLNSRELLARVLHRNEWHTRHARRLLSEPGRRDAETAATLQTLRGALKLDSTTAAPALPTVPQPRSEEINTLRLLWTYHQMVGLSDDDALKLLTPPNPHPYVRGWAIQLALEDQQASPALLETLALLAKDDPSPVVRRFIASGLQRLDPALRYPILSALVRHSEDADDHNLPHLYWYAAEGAVATDPNRAFDLIRSSRIPKVREWIARRLASLSMARAE